MSFTINNRGAKPNIFAAAHQQLINEGKLKTPPQNSAQSNAKAASTSEISTANSAVQPLTAATSQGAGASFPPDYKLPPPIKAENPEAPRGVPLVQWFKPQTATNKAPPAAKKTTKAPPAANFSALTAGKAHLPTERQNYQPPTQAERLAENAAVSAAIANHKTPDYMAGCFPLLFGKPKTKK